MNKEVGVGESGWNWFEKNNDPILTEYSEIMALPTLDFLAHINKLALDAIDSPSYHDQTGKISDIAWKKLVDGGLLGSSLSDRKSEQRQEEIMQILRILSFHDLHLGLTFGIMSGLVIENLNRFSSSSEQRDKYLNKIRSGWRMGLAITEKDGSGSSAIDMRSKYSLSDDGSTATLNFYKHLQGLSGGDLIIALRKANASKATVGLFIVDEEDIETTSTPMLGLAGLSYGINIGENVVIPTKDHLMKELSQKELFTFQDIFTKSRLLFVGMTLGHQERMEHEATLYAKKWVISGRSQIDIPDVQDKLETMRAHRIISREIFNRVKNFRVKGNSLTEGDTLSLVSEANIIKTLTSHYAYLAALSRADLLGGRSFYAGAALQDLVDIWPFRIFEGAEGMLLSQIGHALSRSPLFKEDNINQLFDRSRVALNLDLENMSKLTQIGYGVKSPKQEKVFGSIASRCFALGCLDQSKMEAQEFELGIITLNLEINQLISEYLTKN